MTEDIWAGDYLNRKEDADFLYAYLIQRNTRAVELGEKGTSINVSAPWGAGKSFFLSRFAKQLRADGQRVAEVNAWRDDHADDPIYPVMAAVLQCLGKGSGKAKLRDALKKNAGKIAIRTGRGALKRVAGLVIGTPEVEGVIDDVAKTLAEVGDEMVGEFAEKALERFEDGQQAISDFRAAIEKEVKGQKPLFIFVDELDRCRPTYAISVLERIKHLFDVPNVIFVFATNTDELVHTIKAVYGSGFNASRYLLRFFDRTYQFDDPSILNFVQFRWKEMGLDDGRFLNCWNTQHQQFVAIISSAKQLSLRDIDQCMEMLWSVSEFCDRRVPIPLLYLYPLIVAYHFGEMPAFGEATGETSSSDYLRVEEFQRFFDKVVLHERPIADRMTGRHSAVQITLRQVMEGFKRLINQGLSDGIEGDDWAIGYVNQYRQAEMSIIHRNMWTGNKVPTMLSNYGRMIRTAGRVSSLPEAAH